MSIKAQLIQLANMVHQEEIKYINSLNEAEKNQIGKMDDWSIKDMLVHISVWKAIMAERLAGKDTFEGINIHPDFEDTNIEIYNKYKMATWSEIDQLVNSCHYALIARLEELRDEDLMRVDRYAWQNDRILWQRIYGTDIIHPALHISERYIDRGEVEPALELIETVSKQAMELSDEDSWQGAQHYNIACYHALAGDRDAALEKLEIAFRLQADLVPWAQEDTDLKSLWEDAGFLALIREDAE